VCQVCSNAQYKDGAFVYEGPARDAFVATVSQRMADGLQSRRQIYWKQAWAHEAMWHQLLV
jgi:hypothetical protein